MLSIIESVASQISLSPSVQRIVLFGSQARGDAKPCVSDIDLAVFGVTDEKEWSRLWHLADTAPSLRKIDLIRFEKASLSLQQSILQEGKTLYERH